MGRGGAVAVDSAKLDEINQLNKQVGQLKLANSELNSVVNKVHRPSPGQPVLSVSQQCPATDRARPSSQLTAEKEAQKETLRERHLSVTSSPKDR